MKIEYEIGGVKLNERQMSEIHDSYEVACTAEYLMDNYETITDEDQAMSLARKVREWMSKYNLSEDDAIAEVMSNVDA